MEKFFPENYRQALRDLDKLFTMLDQMNLQTDTFHGFEHARPSADALLAAAIEIWKHQNPWIQREYGEEMF